MSSSHPFCDKPEQNFSVTFLLLYRKSKKDAPLLSGQNVFVLLLIIFNFATTILHIFGKCKYNLIFLQNL